MSDPIKHECGVAIVRLKRPLAHYRERYGSALWGMRKLYLLMEKQRNRGQDGAGIGVLKQGLPFGMRYFDRLRKVGPNCLDRLWRDVHEDLDEMRKSGRCDPDDPVALHRHFPFVGEVSLGHLRYGTHGGNTLDVCHPYERPSNWPSRHLSIAGNFNLTNAEELFGMLVGLGQHPVGLADTSIVLEKIGHFLDVANEALLRKHEHAGLKGVPLATAVSDEVDLPRVLRKAARAWDGGWFMIGCVGHGAAFAFRDPHGIRPGFWYEDDEVVAVASERIALATCFAVDVSAVREVTPGHALIIDHRGAAAEHSIMPAQPRRSCSFERIYFSRGNDPDIYRERKALGRELVPAALAAVDHDLERTVFSYVPNTAEAAYFGLVEGLEAWLAEWRERTILRLQAENRLSPEALRTVLAVRPWQEKAALKDAKLRTFITGEGDRGDLVAHAYDITRGILRPGEDSLVVIDDSIVRGTTLRRSILRMLSQLKPKQIVVLSSCPQIRYPDCYGIDMSELGKFIAFEAAVALLRERGQAAVLDQVYAACVAALAQPGPLAINHVKAVYAGFTDIEISDRIAELVRPKDVEWTGKVKVVYQTVDGLRWAIRGATGDWYFTGDYPTPGGYRVVAQAFVNYMEQRTGRAYEVARG